MENTTNQQAKHRITFTAYNSRTEIKNLPFVEWHNATLEDIRKYASAMCVALGTFYNSVKVVVYDLDTGKSLHTCTGGDYSHCKRCNFPSK